MKNKTEREIVKKILDCLDEGIHVVDKGGNTLVYNRAMADMEKMRTKDVMEKPFKEVFKSMNWEESTLMKAIDYGKETVNKLQTYNNKDGKQITTINRTLPIYEDGEVVAAVEIAKNVTSIKKLSNTIVELQSQPLEHEKAKAHKIRTYNFDNLMGKNGDFVKTIETAKKAAQNSASVFIYGETGTGKELVAQSIHFYGERKEKPFIAQNCAALPATLLEGILFGTAKGGFTGAVDRPGLFEQAEGGTLLLDEISAMPYELQGKLLRVLQEDYVRRVGGTKDIPIDVRIIATVNERAEELIAKGVLRKDLYYRMNIIHLDILPLRERKDDIILLAEQFVIKHNLKYQKSVRGIFQDGKEKLLNYDYPGNVRELENIIMAAVSMADPDELLTAEHLFIPGNGELLTAEPPFIQGKEPIGKEGVSYTSIGLDHYLEEQEKQMIEEALLVNSGNISKAADYLKIKRQTLQHKIKKYGKFTL